MNKISTKNLGYNRERKRESLQKYTAYTNILNNLAKQKKYCYKQVSLKPSSTEPMRRILLILVFVLSLLLAGTTASAEQCG